MPSNNNALVAALPPTNDCPGTMVYVPVVWVPRPLVVPSITLPIVPTQDRIYFDAVDAENSRLLPESMSPVVTSLRTLPYQLPEDILYVADIKAEYVSLPYKEEVVVNTVVTV